MGLFVERYLVATTITHPDLTLWGEGTDLDDKKSYIHSRYRAGPRFFDGALFLRFEPQLALHLIRACMKNRYRAVAVGEAARKRAWRDCRPEGYRSNILAVMKGLTAPEGLGLKSVPWAGQGRSMEVNPARALYSRNLKHRP